ncbi:hypothetical protein NW760_012401 [Fusarium oxysporum]|nr:hypothetical protein NW769_014366 [Fusarium oxysporum]KAJ4219778.1 hypothetical protein NW760_012401 [Fusarium oxysporum]KAJ4269052.1 hypothetical protein NW764_014445 [Fusarium oxysporum]
MFISTVSHFSPAKTEWEAKRTTSLVVTVVTPGLQAPFLHPSSLCLRHFSSSLLSTSTLFSSPLSYNGPHILPSYSFSSLQILYNLTFHCSYTSSWPVLHYVPGSSHSSSFYPTITVDAIGHSHNFTSSSKYSLSLTLALSSQPRFVS